MPDTGRMNRTPRRVRFELSMMKNTRHSAFVDPSGGSADSMTIAVAHDEKGIVVVDATSVLRSRIAARGKFWKKQRQSARCGFVAERKGSSGGRILASLIYNSVGMR
jgi:hypothetical protein